MGLIKTDLSALDLFGSHAVFNADIKLVFECISRLVQCFGKVDVDLVFTEGQLAESAVYVLY